MAKSSDFALDADDGVATPTILFEEFERLQEVIKRKDSIDSWLNSSLGQEIENLLDVLAMLCGVQLGPFGPQAADGSRLFDQ